MPLQIQNTHLGEALVSRAIYLYDALEKVDNLIDWIRADLATMTAHTKLSPPDTLVGRGLSGAMFVPVLARALDLHWAIVRKPSDKSHSTVTVEGTVGKHWVFVDDLISSGETFIKTAREVARTCEAVGWETELVGAWLYAPRHWRSPSSLPDWEPEPPLDVTGWMIPKPLTGWTDPVAQFLSISKSMPSVQALRKALKEKPFSEVMAELNAKPYRPKPPVGKGGRARRRLDRAALNAMLDSKASAALTKQMQFGKIVAALRPDDFPGEFTQGNKE